MVRTIESAWIFSFIWKKKKKKTFEIIFFKLANYEENKKLNSKFYHLKFSWIRVTLRAPTLYCVLLYCKVEAQDLEIFSNYKGVKIQKRNCTITKIIILQKLRWILFIEKYKLKIWKHLNFQENFFLRTQ